MTKINIDIPQSNFELVRDKVAEIIKLELDNQAMRQNNSDFTCEVFIERFSNVNEDEGNVIIVSVDTCELDNQTPVSQSNEQKINIDVFCAAASSQTSPGYEKSGKLITRLCGMITYILQSTVYDRLGFANGIVERRSVKNMRFARISDEQDAFYSRMGRVELMVKTNQTYTGIEPITAAGYDTIMKIALTEKGYKLTYNND